MLKQMLSLNQGCHEDETVSTIAGEGPIENSAVNLNRCNINLNRCNINSLGGWIWWVGLWIGRQWWSAWLWRRLSVETPPFGHASTGSCACSAKAAAATTLAVTAFC